MKNRLLKSGILVGTMITALVTSNVYVKAQTLYSEDFSSSSVPSGMVIINNDGLTQDPNSQADIVTDGWIFRYPTSGNPIGFAVSTSKYVPAGTADDWMITPPISISANNAWLIWEATSYDELSPDGYEVLVSTTGNSISDFTTVLYSNSAENAAAWETRSADLSPYFGQTVYIAFRNNTHDGYMLFIDDILVKVLPSDEPELVSIDFPEFSEVPGSHPVTGVIKNNGYNTIHSIKVNWTDGSSSFTDNITGLNITPYATYEFTHFIDVSVNQDSTYNVDISIDLVNDTDTTNNKLSTYIVGVKDSPKRNHVFEEKTGTWCGWCPRGHIAMRQLEQYDDAIGIAVHNNDPMEVQTYDNGIGEWALGGFPGGVVNRTESMDPDEFVDHYLAGPSTLTPAEVTLDLVSYDSTSHELVAKVSADFVSYMGGDYRFNLVINENGVTGTSNGYEQVNYYSHERFDIPLFDSLDGTDWQALPEDVPAADMIYDHVARVISGGIDGVSGSLPNPILKGSSEDYTFTVSLHPSWDPTKIEVIGWVSSYKTGEILNADKKRLVWLTTTEEVFSSNLSLKIYPNPNDGMFTLQFNAEQRENYQLEVRNVVGQVVLKDQMSISGTVNKSIDLSAHGAGIYFVTLSDGQQKSTIRAIVK